MGLLQGDGEFFLIREYKYRESYNLYENLIATWCSVSNEQNDFYEPRHVSIKMQ